MLKSSKSPQHITGHIHTAAEYSYQSCIWVIKGIVKPNILIVS